MICLSQCYTNLHNSKHLLKLSSLLSIVENCVYRYTEQPPASLDCSLESSNIQLKCKVTGPHNPHDPRLGIKWFRDSEQLQNGSTFTFTSLSEGNNITSTLTVQDWENNQGSYYCQLSISGSTSQTIPSVSLDLEQLHNPGSDCQSNTFFQTEPTCASVPMTRLPSPSVTPTPMLLITSTTQTLVTSHLSLYTSPLPTPSPTVTTGDFTPPSSSSDTSRPPTSDMVTDNPADTGPSGSTTPLQVWLYVVVAVAAVFAMIIIILVIMCVGLCLRKSKTGDLEVPKCELALVNSTIIAFLISYVHRNGLYSSCNFPHTICLHLLYMMFVYLGCFGGSES